MDDACPLPPAIKKWSQNILDTNAAILGMSLSCQSWRFTLFLHRQITNLIDNLFSILIFSLSFYRQCWWLRTSVTGSEGGGLRSVWWREEMSETPRSWWRSWRRCSARDLGSWRTPPLTTNPMGCRTPASGCTSEDSFFIPLQRCHQNNNGTVVYCFLSCFTPQCFWQ